jgi:hypothetical protein
MMTALVLVALLAAFLVAFSRSGIPRDQRLPWHEMDLGDLLQEMINGASRFSQLHSRR